VEHPNKKLAAIEAGTACVSRFLFIMCCFDVSAPELLNPFWKERVENLSPLSLSIVFGYVILGMAVRIVM